MRWKVALCVLTLSIVAYSCDAPNDEPTATTAAELDDNEFSLTGVVLDAKEGAEPTSGLPVAGDLEDDEFGGIAIRPDAPIDAVGLDDCSTTQDAYVAYYTPETDATNLDDDRSWPESIEGARVVVEGTRHAPADDDTDATASADPDVSGTCVLVVDRIEEAEPSSIPAAGDREDDGAAGAQGTASPDGSPGAEEEVAETSFPPVEDTDPIFEGTPSPDPCEGAKACEKQREEERQEEEREEGGS